MDLQKKFWILAPVVLLAACVSGANTNHGFVAQVDEITVTRRSNPLPDEFLAQLGDYGPEIYHAMFVFTDEPYLTGDFSGCEAHGDGSYVCPPQETRSFTREEIIRAAQLATERDSNCSWIEFDEAYDRRARAAGDLAAQDDNRMLFVRLNCS